MAHGCHGAWRPLPGEPQTSDKREASNLEKDRIATIKAGKVASRSGKEFARKAFTEAAEQFLSDKKARVSERTHQFEEQRLRFLKRYFKDRPLAKIRAEEIAAYQKHRQDASVSGRTINMEVGVLRRMLKKARAWNAVAEDVVMFPEGQVPVARVLTAEQKRKLFETAGSKEVWTVAYYAAVLAVSTTCRGVELKNLRWQSVNFEQRELLITRSKTKAGQRKLPLKTLTPSVHSSDSTSAPSSLDDRTRALRISLLRERQCGSHKASKVLAICMAEAQRESRHERIPVSRSPASGNHGTSRNGSF